MSAACRYALLRMSAVYLSVTCNARKETESMNNWVHTRGVGQTAASLTNGSVRSWRRPMHMILPHSEGSDEHNMGPSAKDGCLVFEMGVERIPFAASSGLE